MLKGGVIMDVTTAEEARIAEEAGAVAVMALERVPADIRKDGGVARMSDPTIIEEIKKAVTIPVMAKARIGHFVEAQILESLDVDYIDESEVRGCRAPPRRAAARAGRSTIIASLPRALTPSRAPAQVLTPADETHHINKHNFKVPFVCGCRDLGEALRRIAEGAAMIRTKVRAAWAAPGSVLQPGSPASPADSPATPAPPLPRLAAPSAHPSPPLTAPRTPAAATTCRARPAPATSWRRCATAAPSWAPSASCRPWTRTSSTSTPRRSARPWSWSGRPSTWAACPSSTLPPAAWPPRRTRR
jgi:hypothetical protein